MKRWTSAHWVGIVAALALLGDSALYVVLPPHASELGLTAIQVGILLSANRFVRIGLNDPTARAIDRLGLRAPLVFALLVAALTTGSYGRVGFVAFLGLRIAWGLAWSLLRNGANAAVLAQEPRRRGELQGTFRSLARVGSLTAVLAGAWLVGRIGFARTYEWLGVATLPGVLLAALVFRASATPPERGPAVTVPAATVSSARGSITSVAIAAFFANALGASLLLVTLGAGLARVISGTTPAYAGTLLGLAGAGRWIGEIFVAPLAGHLTDRIGRAPVLVAGGLLAAGGLGGCATAGSPEAFVASAMFAFAMLSTLQTALDALATDRARFSTVALGRYFTVVDVGTAVGPLVGPSLVERFGFARTIACSAAVVALVAIAYMRRGSERRADHARLHADG